MSSSLRQVARAFLISLVALAASQAQAALTLSIEMNPNPVRPLEVLVAQLTVANDGVAAVNNVVLQATVPASIQSFSANYLTGGGTCTVIVNNSLCDTNEIATWTLGTIPAGSAVTVSMPLFVLGSAVAGTTITLPGNVLVNAVSTVTANAAAVVSTTNALSLAVDEDKDRVASGDTLTYTLSYANRAASSSVTGTTLNFPIPAGTTFVSATGGGTLNAGNVEWALGSLPATQSGTQQVVVTVNGGLPAGTALSVNAATISGSSGVPESASATTVTRVGSGGLVVGIEFNPDPLRPNEQGVAQLTVTNRSGGTLTGVVLQARVPQALTSFSPAYLNGAGTCVVVINNSICDPAELLNWAIGSLPAGGGITLTVPIFLANGTAAGRLLVLEALASADGGTRALNSATVAVDTDGPLSLAVEEDKNPVGTGDLLTYTLIYGNRAASSSITGTTLTFPVPAGTTFVSASGGGTLSGGNVQWALGSLPATQSGNQQVVVSVNNGLAGGTQLGVRAASISGLNSSLVTEAARATAIARVAASRPLVLGVEFNGNPVRPNERGIVQLTVSNRGATPLTGVVLQARVPVSVVSFSANYLTGGGTCIVVSNNSLCDPGELMNWNLGTIAAGGGTTVSVPIFVLGSSAAGRLLVLEALVNDDGTNRTVLQANVAMDTDNPLSLSVSDDKNPVAPGDLLTYSLTYGNRAASSNITGTTLTFPIPAGTTFVSASGGGTLSGGNVQWALGSLAATQSGRQKVVVAVNNDVAPGSVLAVNAASIAGLNSSLVAELARATATTRVAAAPPIALAVEFNPDPARPNEQVVAQLTVSNRGGAPLTGVVVQARVPESFNDFSPAGLTDGATCIVVVNNSLCDPGELLNWNVGTLPTGSGRTLSVVMFVAGAAPVGRVLALETLATDDGTNRAVNERVLAVDTDNPLTLAVNENLDAVPASGTIQYAVTYGNRNTVGSVTGATLRFPLPADALLLGSSGGTIVGGDIVWNLGTLAAGAGGRRNVAVSVPGAVANGNVIRVDAVELQGNIVAGVVPDAQRASAVTRVEATKPLGLSLSLAPDPVVASQTLTATLTVTNNSGGTLTGVVLNARVPTPVNDFSPALLTGGGTCIIIVNNSLCDSTELVNWNLGTLLNGAEVTVSMPMVVTAGTVNGRLITVESRVSDDAGKLSTMERTVLLNPFTDTDADTIAQIFDNCTGRANTSQCDSDFDGYGNRCDGDLNNNNFTNAQDTVLFRTQLGQPSVPPVYNEADLNCNGFVNAQDTTLFRGLLGSPAGPSSLAP